MLGDLADHSLTQFSMHVLFLAAIILKNYRRAAFAMTVKDIEDDLEI